MYSYRTPFLFLLVLFCSCDCLQIAQGTVYDQTTGKPLDSVLVYRDAKDLGEYSNEKGEFKFTAISGGLCGCPPLTVKLNKSGYQERSIRFKNPGNDTIYLSKGQ